MNEELRGKLRRLRREERGSSAEETPAEASGSAADAESIRDAHRRSRSLPPWLRVRIAERRRAADRRRPVTGPEAATGPGARGPARREPPFDPLDAERKRTGEPSELEPARSPQGEPFAARRRRFAPEHAHGHWTLGEAVGDAGAAVALLARDPDLAGFDPTRAVYLDVETTGLSGGAGTISFLVALGSFRAAGERDEPEARFTLWQGFLPGPECERALLAEVARRVAAHDALVTFFGKSFDRHRLEDKMRLHGVEPPFADRPHLDLYHPLRRLYGGAFEDTRLQTMERGLCGVERDHDLPGSRAPAAWFDFLAGRPHRLEDVFRHNEDDVLSLVVLTGHLARVPEESRLDGRPLGGPAAARARSLARLFEEQREEERALLWNARAAERIPVEEDGHLAARELAVQRARLLARAGRPRTALALFEEVAHGDRDGLALESCIAAAKVAEHRTREWARALCAVERAIELLPAVIPGRRRARRARMRDELERRRARLAARAPTEPRAEA